MFHEHTRSYPKQNGELFKRVFTMFITGEVINTIINKIVYNFFKYLIINTFLI